MKNKNKINQRNPSHIPASLALESVDFEFGNNDQAIEIALVDSGKFELQIQILTLPNTRGNTNTTNTLAYLSPPCLALPSMGCLTRICIGLL